MRIDSNFFYFCSYVIINGTIKFSVEKIHNPGIIKSDFRANGATGSAKNAFWGGSMQDQNTVLDLPAIPYIVKTFWKCTRVVYILTLNQMVPFILVSLHRWQRYGRLSIFAGGSRPPRNVKNRLALLHVCRYVEKLCIIRFSVKKYTTLM